MKLLQIVLSLFVISFFQTIENAQAEDTPALPFIMEWPKDWKSTRLPSAPLANGKSLGGERIRLIKTQNGALAAVIELTYIPRTDAGNASLDFEFNTALRDIKSGYEAKNFIVNMGTSSSANRFDTTWMESEFIAINSNQVLRQWLGMALSEKYLYSLTYSALKDNYEHHQADFNQVRTTLKIK